MHRSDPAGGAGHVADFLVHGGRHGQCHPAGRTAALADPRSLDRPSHHLVKGFRNLDPSYDYTLAGRAAGLLRRVVEPHPDRGTPPVPVANDGAALRANGSEPTVTWVGHATLLVQLDGVNILTDPIWSSRAGPFGIGPKRLVPPGLRFDDLPPIHVVLISHDHYDHLDARTVEHLARVHHPRFFVPLGLGGWMAGHGVSDVVELDWWQRRAYRGLTFVATPAQHGSGRTLTDQNRRLWCSWAVLGHSRRFFFAGDTGYTPALADMTAGNLYYAAAGRVVAAGLMDLTPNGAFEAWRPVSGQEAVDVIEGLVRLVGP